MRVALALLMLASAASADDYPKLQLKIDNRPDTGLTCDDNGQVIYVDGGKLVSADWFGGKYEWRFPPGPRCELVWKPAPQPPAIYRLAFGE